MVSGFKEIVFSNGVQGITGVRAQLFFVLSVGLAVSGFKTSGSGLRFPGLGGF